MNNKTCSHRLGFTVCSRWLLMTWDTSHVKFTYLRSETRLKWCYLVKQILWINYMFDFKLSFVCYMFWNLCHCQIFYELRMNHTSPHEDLTEHFCFLTSPSPPQFWCQQFILWSQSSVRFKKSVYFPRRVASFFLYDTQWFEQGWLPQAHIFECWVIRECHYLKGIRKCSHVGWSVSLELGFGV